jgi:glycosidase
MPLIYGGQEAGLNKRLAFFDKDGIDWSNRSRAILYVRLLRLKHRHPALSSAHTPGNLELIETGNPKVFAFRRIAGRDRVRVVVNLSAAPATVTLPGSRPLALAGWAWHID